MMPVNRELLRKALHELVQLKSGAENPTRLLFQLYTSALEDWAWQLGVEPHKLNRLVVVRQAVSDRWLH
jgi:hypothetical protein